MFLVVLPTNCADTVQFQMGIHKTLQVSDKCSGKSQALLLCSQTVQAQGISLLAVNGCEFALTYTGEKRVVFRSVRVRAGSAASQAKAA
jgi:hypothetical protein